MIYRKYIEMAIFKLFLLASVKESFRKRLFYILTSYPSWRKRQNNLILMVAEIEKRVFTSGYRTAPQNQLQFLFALFPYTWVAPHLGWIRLYSLEERKTIKLCKDTACLAPPILDAVLQTSAQSVFITCPYISACLYRMATCSF